MKSSAFELNFILRNRITLYLLTGSLPIANNKANTHYLPILNLNRTNLLTLSFFVNSAWFDVLSRSRPSANLVTGPFSSSDFLRGCVGGGGERPGNGKHVNSSSLSP